MRVSKPICRVSSNMSGKRPWEGLKEQLWESFMIFIQQILDFYDKFYHRFLSVSRAKASASCKSVEEEIVHRKKFVASKALQWPKPSQP